MGKSYHLGLIGYPIEHSLSPLLHGAALQACGFDGDYQLFPIVDFPEGENPLKMVIERIRRGELDGANITIPHKQNAFFLVDKLSPTASGVGAMNTIYKDERILHGENTDVTGFMNDLKRVGIEKRNNPLALILGAGGAARAVIWGLLTDGWRVIVLARRNEQAQQVVDWVSQKIPALKNSNEKRISASSLNARAIQHLASVEAISLIVNATPLGMVSHPQGIVWPVKIPLPRNAILYDLVYTPPETELIKLARQAGLPAFNGLGMLVEQAALAFEIWTGVQAPRDAMWQAIKNVQETT